ncbi:putative nucleic acid-binding protein, contains PIN domain [Thermococcus cleftensis]|uniref:Ribonuclease VapC n=1 Tax=Thermococcus cleftensis (strain DSM 27260 / KACC 17922 / CL1) TaxID=163003 RepID=I3ZRE5_THECF|nr:type II toxin-antitoxin system VapC family toxin [Thermococcus sp. MV11]AFL94279.1 putative nucleic acid-binding protein, contains PIN domain [Thermococcus cleftensis]NJE03368.1 PIN domain-containing protein [Thermococcus sp. MV11]
MRSFLVDSNVFIEALKGDGEAEDILSRLLRSDWRVFINDVVFSEVMYHFIRIRAGSYWSAKKNPEKVSKAVEEFERVVLPMLAIPDFLEVNYDISTIALRVSKTYGLLPNDALILATAEYYGVDTLVSLDRDFKSACRGEGIKLVTSIKEL